MNSPKVNEKPAKGQNSKRLSILLSPSDSQEQINDDESIPSEREKKPLRLGPGALFVGCGHGHFGDPLAEEGLLNGARGFPPSDWSEASEDVTTNGREVSRRVAQILERVKPDRVSTAKQDEDRRRRTIIVEKKNGSYGFTLQSYGIHYKKEQEIEMITYVDYVEYDGPAYKAGMREGDVILSINGHDMEKADHKTLVNFIKNCDTRMRMVVLFEDCVRKVELHIRYIQLQRILQSKTAELDRLCLKERELLQGKWKSQSLPARKKGTSSTQSELGSPCQEEPYCRPTVSTEDVAKVPSQSQLFLAYYYLDPRYQYVLRSEKNSKEFLVGWSQSSQDSKAILVKPNCDGKSKRCTAKGYHQSNGVISADIMKRRSKAEHHHHSRHLCNPCLQAINNQDNNSLEAYDLASPCCDPHCVPSARRKSKHQKHKHGHHSNSHNHESYKENIKCRIPKDKNQEGSHRIQKSNHRSHKYFSFGSNLVSQFSLHSCTSSDISNSAGLGESSGVSCTTSLSSDTLYWDRNQNKSQTKQHSSSYSRSSSCKNNQSRDSYQSYNPVKPKSWDNLTTKSFGGYGFGYGYVEAGNSHKSQSNASACISSNTMPAKIKSQSKANGMKVNLNQINFKSQSGGRVHSIQIYHNGHHHYVQPVKSSENLLEKQESGLTNSSLSCECLEIGSPAADDKYIKRFFPYRSGEILYYHQDKASQTEGKQRRGSENQSNAVSRL